MNVVEILEGKGRIQLVNLASLLLPSPIEEDEFDGEECEEDCEECEEDEEESGRMSCKLRNATAFQGVD